MGYGALLHRKWMVANGPFHVKILVVRLLSF